VESNQQTKVFRIHSVTCRPSLLSSFPESKVWPNTPLNPAEPIDHSMITKTGLEKKSNAPPKLPFYIPLFNHAIRSFLRIGVPLGYVGLLTVKGRKTGKTRRNPVGLFEYNGKRYVFSTFGNVNWVRNVRAAGTATVRKRWRSQRVLLVELSPIETAKVLKEAIAPRFLGLGGKVFGSHFPLKPDAPLAAFIEESKRHPVFELRDANN
jgi:deazaflavin-dependent oxidoreductase (nitroreductase family)